MRLTPKQFYALTIRQYQLMYEGYEREIRREDAKILESWRQARLIAFNAIIPHLKDNTISIYDYYPLPNDPTKEDLIKARDNQRKKDVEWMKSVLDNYRKSKII